MLNKTSITFAYKNEQAVFTNVVVIFLRIQFNFKRMYLQIIYYFVF